MELSANMTYIGRVKVRVCTVRELAEGESRTIKVLARRVAVFHIAGTFYGLEADCKHMKASIAHGTISGTTITCPAHGWQYDIPTGTCLTESWASLKTYPVIIEDESLFVEIS